MQTVLDQGVLGAKRQSWQRQNPRDTLLHFIQKNPNANEDTIRIECWEVLKRDVANKAKGVDKAILFGALDNSQLRIAYEYWFANNYRSLVVKPISTEEEREERRQQREARRQEAIAKAKKVVQSHNAKVEEKVKIQILSMMMPSGKTFGNSTKEELSACGGWMVNVAFRLKPGQTVLQAGIREEELRSLNPLPIKRK
jgi:hypothetical protein